MKKRFLKIIRNIFVVSTTWCGGAWLYRKLHAKPLVRVVVFHNTPDSVWFEQMLKTLTSEFHVLTPQEFQNHNYNPQKINVLVTFDDGYASWISHALPLLEQYGITAIFFINSGLMNLAEDTEKTNHFMKKRLHLSPKPALSWTGVRTLYEKGHTIGGHTKTHAHLGKVSEKKVTSQIVTDKSAIEQFLGKEITEFAYPFGTRKHVTVYAQEQARQAGYARAYTAISRYVQDETYTIPRMCIETGISPRMLKYWVYGAYDLFDIVKSLCVR